MLKTFASQPRRRWRHAPILAAALACAAAGFLLSPGSGAARSQVAFGTSTVSASDSNFSLTVSGPDAYTIPSDTAPQYQYWQLTVAYIGTPLAPDDHTTDPHTTVTVTLPQNMLNPGITDVSNGGAGVSDCVFGSPGVVGVSWSCTFHFSPTITSITMTVGARPYFDAPTGPATFSYVASSGASTTFTMQLTGKTDTTTTTTTTDSNPTSTTTSTSTSTPEVPAAPPTTTTETFTDTTQTQSEAVPVAPNADTAQIGLSWTDPSASFDVTGVTVTSTTGSLSLQSAQTKPKLVISKKRTPTSLRVRVKGLHRGKLHYKIVPRRLHGKTRVKTTVTQLKPAPQALAAAETPRNSEFKAAAKTRDLAGASV